MQSSASIAPSQLSLFDLDAEPAQVVGAVRASAPPPAPLPVPGPLDDGARAATQAVAPPTPAAPDFHHPRAHHELRLGEHLVGFELRRAKRRSIGFTISTEGLRVSAPKWVPLRDIHSALQERHVWILRKLHEQRERAKRLQSNRVEWRDGTSIPYLGEPMVVVLDPRAAGETGSALLSSGQAPQQPGLVSGLTLHVGLAQHASPEQIRDTVQSWLQRQARTLFLARCQHFAAQLGVRMTKLTLSSAQTRWGSASADGSIRLNWRLIHFAESTIDYVVVHELAHLREMNHSPRFWEVVRSVVPDYKNLRGSLHGEIAPVLD